MRPIYIIADEIRGDWKKVSAFAAPYLMAMNRLNAITDSYYSDSGASIVMYFLVNANGWHGETARRVKKELKHILKNQQDHRKAVEESLESLY